MTVECERDIEVEHFLQFYDAISPAQAYVSAEPMVMLVDKRDAIAIAKGISVVRTISCRAKRKEEFDLAGQWVLRDHMVRTYEKAFVDSWMRELGVWEQQTNLQVDLLYLDFINI